MVITRVYNNSCAAVTDEDGREMIVTGRGAVFGKKAGDLLNEALVEKRYVLEDPKLNSRLDTILSEIDQADVYLEISEEVLTMIRAQDYPVNESLLLTLTDHISTSLERERKGIILANPLLLDIRQLYHAQYLLAEQAAQIIAQRTGVTVSPDEVGFITLHIVSASTDGRFNDLLEITHIIQKILTLVESKFDVHLNVNSMRYERFIRHLQFFARRILDSASEQETNLLMYNMGRVEFPDAFLCVKDIARMIERDYQRKVSDAEQGYLIYHIMNVILETREKKQS